MRIEESEAVMVGRNLVPHALVSCLLLTLAACKDKPETTKTDDLPDLNKQIRSYVTVGDTSVRSGPGERFKTVGLIKSNAKVHVVGRDGDWLLIVSKKGNAPGYINIAAAKPGEGEEQEQTNARPIDGRYEALADTQVRSGPGPRYAVVAEIRKGTKLNVVGEEEGWLKVESKRGKKPGYVDARRARRDGEP
jgi:uncharacterized protein YgiM (DUF1202 family)